MNVRFVGIFLFFLIAVPAAFAQDYAPRNSAPNRSPLLALGDSSAGENSDPWWCRILRVGCSGGSSGGSAGVEIDAEQVADKAVEYVRGDVPSPLMENLLSQMAAEGKFKLWTLKTQNRNAPYFADACQRAANQRAMEGIRNARDKARLAPWVDISWEAVKGISTGGKSVADLIKENAIEKAEALVQEALFGKADQVIETVTIPHYDDCNTQSKVTWDPVQRRIIVESKGDCGCAFFSAGTGNANEGERLRGFNVSITAPVTVEQVRIQEKNRFIFWRSYSVQARYKVGRLNVATTADCACRDIVDPPPPPPPPPPPKKEKGWLAGIVDWIIDIFDGSDDDTGGDTDTGGGDGEEGAGDEEVDDTGAVGEDMTGEDDDGTGGERDEKEDGGTEDETKEEEPQNEDAGDDSGAAAKPKCGDRISIDGRDNVPTFSSTVGPNRDANFTCNNSCGQNEVCRVLPPETGMLGCVYCAEVCKPGEFIDRYSCEQAKTSDIQYCESTGVSTWGDETCYALKERQSNACQEAVKFIFKDYFAWVEPPLSFSGSGATFSNDQRCVSEEEYQETVRQVLDEALSDPQLKAMCPTLELVSSQLIKISGGAKGVCRDEIKFRF